MKVDPITFAVIKSGLDSIRIKAEDEISKVVYPFNPLDVVGWKGDLTVWKINLRDIRPVMSPRAHLPPSAHSSFVTEGAVMAALGVVAGACSGYAAARVIASFIQQTELPGLVPVAGAALVLLLAAVLASVIPAARAARVDVMQALRSE